jgi:hypothetical protein
MDKTMANARVYWATEENAFEMQVENFDTIEDAKNYLEELANDVELEIENNSTEGVDTEGYEFYAYVVESKDFQKIEDMLENLREQYIEENF